VLVLNLFKVGNVYPAVINQKTLVALKTFNKMDFNTLTNNSMAFHNKISNK